MSLPRLAGQVAELEAKRPGHYRPYFVKPAPNSDFKVCTMTVETIRKKGSEDLI